MPQTLQLNLPSTALVLIDLQNAIVARELKPHDSKTVVANCLKLAGAMRAAHGTVVLVHVKIDEILSLPADQPTRPPGSPPPPPGASDYIPELGNHPGDIRITKRQWGAFYDTGLDQQLRRRNIRTIILGGIATNIGVESTARAAFDMGYELIFAEDAMSTMSAEWQTFAITQVFPRMGRVRSAEQIVEAIKA